MKHRKLYIYIILGLLLLAGVVMVLRRDTLLAGELARFEGALETTNPLDKQIHLILEKLEASPKVKDYIAVANLYLQKVRETADAAYYQVIDQFLLRAKRLDPQDPEVRALQAAVAMGRHDFVRAKMFAEDALAADSSRPSYFGLLGDAQIELGEYEQATQSFQKMVDLRPDFSSYTRVAYIREIYGDRKGAEEALHRAITAGASYTENIAWAYVELGKLALRDDVAQARLYFNQALAHQPGYAPVFAGLGKIALAEGNQKDALVHFEKAFVILPIAQYATDIGDAYRASGDTTRAAQQYALAMVAYQSSAQSGVNTDLETALFLADHNLDLEQALDQALAAYKIRPSIYTADAVAWVYYKLGDDASAKKYIDLALAIGEYDPMIVYHAGVIMNDSRLISVSKKLAPNLQLLYEQNAVRL